MAIRKYLDDLDGELPCNLFDTVISEIEQPMLKTVLRHCDNNQSRTASCLGIIAEPCVKNLSSTISNISTRYWLHHTSPYFHTNTDQKCSKLFVAH